MSRRRTEPLLLLSLLGLFAGAAAALETDRQQPLHIQADRVELDNRKGIGTYRGNVVVDQGTLHLEADLLVLHKRGEELERLEATGEPVRFRQRPDNASADVEGEALRLEYRTDQDRLLLNGAAEVRQGGDRFSGERIEYDTVRALVNASGTGTGNGRVHAVIQPKGSTPPQPPAPQPDNGVPQQ